MRFWNTQPSSQLVFLPGESFGQAMVHAVTKNQTWLKWLNTHELPGYGSWGSIFSCPLADSSSSLSLENCLFIFYIVPLPGYVSYVLLSTSSNDVFTDLSSLEEIFFCLFYSLKIEDMMMNKRDKSSSTLKTWEERNSTKNMKTNV